MRVPRKSILAGPREAGLPAMKDPKAVKRSTVRALMATVVGLVALATLSSCSPHDPHAVEVEAKRQLAHERLDGILPLTGTSELVKIANRTVDACGDSRPAAGLSELLPGDMGMRCEYAHGALYVIPDAADFADAAEAVDAFMQSNDLVPPTSLTAEVEDRRPEQWAFTVRGKIDQVEFELRLSQSARYAIRVLPGGPRGVIAETSPWPEEEAAGLVTASGAAFFVTVELGYEYWDVYQAPAPEAPEGDDPDPPVCFGDGDCPGG